MSGKAKSAEGKAAVPQRRSSKHFLGATTKLWEVYKKETPMKLQLIDSYLAFVMFSGIAVFLYCMAIGSYNYHSFVSGFAATVGTFVLTVNLRIQSNPLNKRSGEFPAVSEERAFADFLFCSTILFFFVFNFIG